MAIRTVMARPTPGPETGVPDGGRSHGRVRTMARIAGAIMIGLWLTWQVIGASLSSMAVATSDPQLLSIMGGPSHPEAGAMLAEGLLRGGDGLAAGRMARSVVLVDPVDVTAMRVLGLATIAAGQAEQGAAIMRQAGLLGWRDTPTQLWVLRDAIMTGDYTTAIQRADALARRNQAGDLTSAIFLASLTDPKLRAALAERLGNDPMWRGAFFASVRQYLPEGSTGSMEALFAAMRVRDETITPVEWLSYVDRLVDLGEFSHARAIWAKAFGIPVGRLTALPYDGDFREATARSIDTPFSQFEWTLNPDLADTLIAGEGGAGLLITPGVTGGTTLASQFVILSPGEHVLTAQIDAHANPPAATWTFTCMPSKLDLPRESPAGADDNVSSVTIDVPAHGCDAVRVSLVSVDRPAGQPVAINSVRIR